MAVGSFSVASVCSAGGPLLWFVVCLFVFPLMQFWKLEQTYLTISDDTFMECFGLFTGLCRSECSFAPREEVTLLGVRRT